METKSKKMMGLLMLGCILILVSAGFLQAQTERWVYKHPTQSRANANVYGGDNIYAAGYLGAGLNRDFFIMSTDTQGNVRWTYSLGGSDSIADVANDIIYADGDVFASGYLSNASVGKDFVIIGLDNTGSSERVYTYDGSASGDDAAKAICYGADGNVYAAGYGTDGSYYDIVIVSISTDRTERWTVEVGTNFDDVANAIVYGDDDYIYIAGYANGGPNDDIVVAKYDTAGNYVWHYLYNGTGDGDDVARQIVYGDDGNLYIAGNTEGSGTFTDFTVLSLDTDGNFRWVYSYDGLADSLDGANSIVYGNDGRIYIAGYSHKGTQDDITIICLDANGNEQWVYLSDITLQDRAKAIVYGNDDNLYVAGYINVQTEKENFAVISVDNTGSERWIYTMEGGLAPMNEDVCEDLAFGTDGNVYAAGYLTMRNLAIISLDSRCLPDAWISPSSFYIQLYEGETTDRPMRISNIGNGEMDWSISEKIGSDWLSVSDTIGNLAPGDTADLTVYFDATTLATEHYYDTLIISINNPYNPEIIVPIHLWVKEGSGIEDYLIDAVEDRCEINSSLFNKQISLSFTKASDTPCEIIIYNILGARVYKKSIPCTPSTINLNDEGISRLSRGVYFLSVRRVAKTYPVRKLMKF
jgi:hypothetical protein